MISLRVAIAGLLFIGWSARCADSSRWEKTVADLEQAARQSAHRRIDVLLYGSSSFRLWTNAAAAFPGVTLLNHGFGGSQLSDLNHYFDRLVLPYAPRILLVYGGDNDIAAGKSPGQVLADFEALVRRVRRDLPRTRVAFVAVKPSPRREKLLGAQAEANALVRRFARRHRKVDFIDTASILLSGEGRPDPRFFVSDLLHLNAAGYEAWRRKLTRYLNRWIHR
jgi:lysophospholipase L1-like esterase